MEIKIEYTDRVNNVVKAIVSGAYLSKFVKLNKKYPVSYTIDNQGNRINKPAWLKGEDLTEPQIVDLFVRQKL